MIIKLEKIINCSSEHPDFPASNLLQNHPPGPWKCAKPGEMMATVTFELPEPSCLIGVDISNYRACVVILDASTSAEPDKWIPLLNHQFLTHDEAANGKFKDQVQLFTKKELNSDTIKMKFDRVKVTCMQSANRKELFGLSFITLRTEVVIDIGLDVFGRFKLKTDDVDKPKSEFKEKYFRLFPEKAKTYKEDLVEKIKEAGVRNFNKRQQEEKTPKKRPLLEKLEAGKSEEVFDKQTNDRSDSPDPAKNNKLNRVVRTPFGDIVSSPNDKTTTPNTKNNQSRTETSKRKQSIDNDNDDAGPSRKTPTSKPKRKSSDEDLKKEDCCNKKCKAYKKGTDDELCVKCKKLLPQRPIKSPPPKKPKVLMKQKIEFSKLLDGVKFSLSGYVNPQREEIRTKALKMGAQYIADPNTTNKKCTHLICAFKNTPKSQQLKGHAKIIQHIFIEECFDHKKR